MNGSYEDVVSLPKSSAGVIDDIEDDGDGDGNDDGDGDDGKDNVAARNFQMGSEMKSCEVRVVGCIVYLVQYIIWHHWFYLLAQYPRAPAPVGTVLHSHDDNDGDEDDDKDEDDDDDDDDFVAHIWSWHWNASGSRQPRMEYPHGSRYT